LVNIKLWLSLEEIFFAKKNKAIYTLSVKKQNSLCLKILYAIIASLSVLVLAILGLLICQNFKNSKTNNQVNSNSPDEATTDKK